MRKKDILDIILRLCCDDLYKADSYHTREFKPDLENWKKILDNIPAQLLCSFYEKIKKNKTALRIPKSAISGLDTKFHGFLQRYLLMKNYLKKICHVFNQREIRFILLKGVALEKRIYKAHSRFCTDIDLLVSKNDMFKAEKILKTIGYQAENLFSYNYSKSHKQHVTYQKLNGAVVVELHFYLAEQYAPFIFDDNFLFQNSKSVMIYGKRIRVLSDELMFIHLCIHFSYIHAFSSPLISSYEIAVFLKESELNWNALLNLCCYSNSTEFVFQTISFVSRWFKVNIPAITLKKMQQKSNKSSLILLKIFSPKSLSDTSVFISKLRKWSLKLLFASNCKKKLLVFSDLLLSSKHNRLMRKIN